MTEQHQAGSLSAGNEADAPDHPGYPGEDLGKLLLRIRVVRLDGKMVGLGWALVRTLLLLLIAPPLIADHDLRAMHDRASNTVVVRT